jgi:FO synthase
MGIMLECVSERLCEPGGPHHGSPDKHPAARLATLEAAGVARIPMTTGLLIGIGETRAERIASLAAIRDLHARHGHIQEVIIQNFRAKPGTRMADHPEPGLDEHLWTIAAARLILGGEMTIQAPPNLQRPEDLPALLPAGVNDWGGVSPVTADHVNPEAPWPHLAVLEQATSAAGRQLHERLAIGPRHAVRAETWVDPALRSRVLRAIDGRGLPKTDLWAAGVSQKPPPGATRPASPAASLSASFSEDDIVRLFRADEADAHAIAAAADRLREQTAGPAVSYVINQNINYTNICLYRCGFCAFSKGSTKALRGPAYRMDFAEIGRRAAEAVSRGATEVCLQGGIHPDYDGNVYRDIVRAVRAAAPGVHIHAFSPLEILHGATTLGRSVRDFLAELRDEGLSTLPGTAAEILDPEVRTILCPDKLTADEWIEVMRAAHSVGLRSTSTIMFGHVDEYRHWARHLLRVRALQEETGGFTEFVPLPFVHPEAPIWRRGQARSGPSWREAMLMHAVARIVLHPVIPNIQVSWVKMGREGAAAMLNAGANDLGGTLMSESITSAAGGQHGREMGEDELIAISAAAGRPSRQRTTLYGEPARPALLVN